MKLFVAVVVAVFLGERQPLYLREVRIPFAYNKGKLAAGVYLAENNICYCITALHTGVVGKED